MSKSCYKVTAIETNSPDLKISREVKIMAELKTSETSGSSARRKKLGRVKIGNSNSFCRLC